ncbi:MAG: hypothetical protein ACP5PM_01175 [Acidimicrobiales bacterium]
MTTPFPLEARDASDATRAPAAPSDPGPATGSEVETLVVANEFAEVLVQRVLTHNGVRLEVSSPRLHRAVRLDPLQLEALTWQEAAAFSAMLTEPFGPSGEKEEPAGIPEGPPERARAKSNGRAHGDVRR